MEKKAPQKTRGEAPRRVCFVCTGNTCRSPMAAAVANALAATQTEEKPLLAFSAGLFACEGEPIAKHAVAALERAEISAVAHADYHVHTAHTLTVEEAQQYDLLIGVSASHAMQLLMRFPQCAPAIVCLPTDVSDPYGGDAETYRACLAQIKKGVEALLFSGGRK